MKTNGLHCNTFLRFALSSWVKAPGCVEGCMSHWYWGSSPYYNREKSCFPELMNSVSTTTGFHFFPDHWKVRSSNTPWYTSVLQDAVYNCLSHLSEVTKPWPREWRTCRRYLDYWRNQNPGCSLGFTISGFWVCSQNQVSLGVWIYTKGLQSTLMAAWQLCCTCGAKGCCLH